MKNAPFHRCFIIAMTLVAICLSACKPSIPSKYIQPGEMEDILYDYYVSKSMANNGSNPAFDRTLYYRETLKKHGVTEAEFDSSLVYYYTDAEQLAKIYKNVGDRLGDEAKSLGASVGAMGDYADMATTGDTTNVWNDAPMAVLMPMAPCNRIDFSLKADTTYHKGDAFVLSFTADFIYQSGTKDAVAYVAVTYDNDSVAVSQTHVNMSGMATLQIPGNDRQNIRSIRGFIYLAQGYDMSEGQKLMFISNIKMIKFRKKEQTAPAPGDMQPADNAVRSAGPDGPQPAGPGGPQPAGAPVMQTGGPVAAPDRATRMVR